MLCGATQSRCFKLGSGEPAEVRRHGGGPKDDLIPPAVPATASQLERDHSPKAAVNDGLEEKANPTALGSTAFLPSGPSAAVHSSSALVAAILSSPMGPSTPGRIPPRRTLISPRKPQVEVLVPAVTPRSKALLAAQREKEVQRQNTRSNQFTAQLEVINVAAAQAAAKAATPVLEASEGVNEGPSKPVRESGRIRDRKANLTAAPEVQLTGKNATASSAKKPAAKATTAAKREAPAKKRAAEAGPEDLAGPSKKRKAVWEEIVGVFCFSVSCCVLVNVRLLPGPSSHLHITVFTLLITLCHSVEIPSLAGNTKWWDW